MVAGDGIGHEVAEGTVTFNRDDCSASCVVNADRVASDPPLKLIGVLTQVVQQACQVGESVAGKRGGVSSGNLRNRF